MSAPGPMIRLRQPVIATSQLDRVVELLQSRLGLGVSHRVEDAPSHAEFGLRAAHLPVGEQFIEVVEPCQTDVPVARHRQRLGGDGGYMVILHVPSLAAAKQRVLDQGARIVWEGGDAVRAIHLHPRDTGGILLSLAEDRLGDEWEQAGKGWRAHVRTDVVTSISRADIACLDPGQCVETWSRLLGIGRQGTDGLTLQLADGRLRFVQAVGQPHGPSGLALRAAAPVDPGPVIKIGNLDISLVSEVDA